VVLHLERFPESDLPAILARARALGIGSVRGVVFPWSSVEAPRGRWKWQSPDAQLSAVEESGLDPVGHLGPSASWASSLDPKRESSPWGWSDYPPDDMAAWAEYVRRIVQRYRGRIRVWSPFNEPDNLDLFCPPRTASEATDPAFLARRRTAFLQMQRITFVEAKKADPGCTVLSGAFSMGGRVDPGFIPWLMSNRYGDLFDVFDVHAYDTTDAIRASVMQARRHMARHDIRRPVWMSELGAAVSRAGRGGMPFTREDAAAFVPKAIVTALSLGVERLFWYQGYRDGASGQSYDDPAHSIILEDGPTPAAAAFASMARLLGQSAYAGPMTCTVVTGKAVGYRFETSEGMAHIVWAEAPDGLPNTPARAEAIVTVSDRRARLTLSNRPTILVTGAKRGA
jgi:hypothetical protein